MPGLGGKGFYVSELRGKGSYVSELRGKGSYVSGLGGKGSDVFIHSLLRLKFIRLLYNLPSIMSFICRF